VSRFRGFTLIELLVVVTIIGLLLAIMVPTMKVARAQSREVSCRSNMHQLHVALDVYANEQGGWFPLTPIEGNPHTVLIDALDARRGNLISAMYCPQAYAMEEAAQDTKNYPPKGKSTSVIDSDTNRAAGNISFLYWSMKDRSDWRSTDHTKYAEPMDSFRPRRLRNSGLPIPLQPSDPCTPCALQVERGGNYWVLCDFFRQSAPFPHVRKHASGLNILFLDGHGEWVSGQPRAVFK
jgi:prepilin-type N-terminal cleavage/methylation domain-containing protein/prepilin-type processing-associated H-X9-DG protein